LLVQAEQDLVDLAQAPKGITLPFFQPQQKVVVVVEVKSQVLHLVAQVVGAELVTVTDLLVPLERLVKATLAAMGQEE
jgi:hypothetical protein